MDEFIVQLQVGVGVFLAAGADVAVSVKIGLQSAIMTGN